MVVGNLDIRSQHVSAGREATLHHLRGPSPQRQPLLPGAPEADEAVDYGLVDDYENEENRSNIKDNPLQGNNSDENGDDDEQSDDQSRCESDDTVELEDGIEWEKVEIMPAQRGYMTSQLCKTMTKTVAALHVVLVGVAQGIVHQTQC